MVNENIKEVESNENKPSAEEVIKQFNELSIQDILREIAEEEGMSYEEVEKMFKQGVRDVNGIKSAKKVDKTKKKKLRKIKKKSQKRNRK